LENARAVNRTRAFFYKKYLTNYKSGMSLKGGSVVEFAGKFGLIGFISAGFDLTEQYVGTMDVDIYVDEKGENLLFILSNNTSTTSATYHISSSYTRTEEPRMGNMFQVYIFKEPITNVGFVEATTGSDSQRFLKLVKSKTIV